jgi:hypothetical protein
LDEVVLAAAVASDVWSRAVGGSGRVCIEYKKGRTRKGSETLGIDRHNLSGERQNRSEK